MCFRWSRRQNGLSSTRAFRRYFRRHPSQMQFQTSDPPKCSMRQWRQKLKAKKRQVIEVEATQPSSAQTIVVADKSSAPIAPATRLSFANISSGRLVRELFNLQ